jgi:hypothetical protein
MARALLGSVKQDLMDDSGSVLWSFVKGEQLEFPIVIEFIKNALDGYLFECVVVEALNVARQEEPPIDIRPDGAQTVLNFRLPDFVGVWDENSSYNYEEVVEYEDKYYKLDFGVNYSNTISPDVDMAWSETTLNRIYVQFPKELAADWAVKPTANFPMYGFFELRVTEPLTSLYQKTWKPVRGLVQILFSPTHLVPD